MNTVPPPYLYDYYNSFLPSAPQLKNRDYCAFKEYTDDAHPIFYLETPENTQLITRPHLHYEPFCLSSARYEEGFHNYCYFLLFTNLRNQSHRYGLYFNPLSHSLLEVKLTLYSYPHHPVFIKILLNEELYVEQACFAHMNFNFLLPWSQVITQNITIELEFIRGYKYHSQFKFINLISV